MDWIAGSRRCCLPPVCRHPAYDSQRPELVIECLDAQLHKNHPSVLELCDALPDDELATIRCQHPDVALTQVIHVGVDNPVTEAARCAGACVKELRGTRRVHDWHVTQLICNAVSAPEILIGGLRSENVAEAVRKERPFGVDVCSGVRRNGWLESGDAHRAHLDTRGHLIDGRVASA